MMKYSNYLTKIIKSFSYAFSGIGYCIKNEINMRFHIVATIFVIILSKFYDFSKAELIVLFLTISLVMGFEIINTSIETLVNMVSPEYNNLAKITKDAAAGAVLVSAIFAFFIAFLLFWDLDVFKKIFIYYSENIANLCGVILIIIISYLFIFKCFKMKKPKNNITLRK